MLVGMPNNNANSAFMRACQVVGEKGIYQALVDAVDDAGDWTHQQLTKGTPSIRTWAEDDYRPRPCTAVRKPSVARTPSTTSTPGTATPPSLPSNSPPLSTQQPPAGGLVNHYQNIAHALNGSTPLKRAEAPAGAPDAGLPRAAAPLPAGQAAAPAHAAADVGPPAAFKLAPATPPSVRAAPPRPPPAEASEDWQSEAEAEYAPSTPC